eukprot:TRINITY_DN22537_c0_g1_i1.p1 TRINITY_DN22537_c0_g1~~TRINITY_DN22537_c0_g1_i1.p1  ORF type:complete len:464 (-),score=71.21 TRINITY_DN22537_c0_g1_i1:227-1618(-)
MAAEDELGRIAFKIADKEIALADEPQERPRTGDRGQIAFRLRNAALKRRGDLEDLKDHLRIYDHHDERDWLKKYNHFSVPHMKDSGYKIATNARHDPCNKGPGWCRQILAALGTSCKKRGISLQELFKAADFYRDNRLRRQELRRIILSVQSKLSKAELTHLFDFLGNGRDAIDMNAFLSAVHDAMEPREHAGTAYRAPVRAQGYAPRVTDHQTCALEDAEYFQTPVTLDAPEDADKKLRGILSQSGRGRRLLRGRDKNKFAYSRYHFFGGGGNGSTGSSRFERAMSAKANTRSKCEAGAPADKTDVEAVMPRAPASARCGTPASTARPRSVPAPPVLRGERPDRLSPAGDMEADVTMYQPPTSARGTARVTPRPPSTVSAHSERCDRQCQPVGGTQSDTLLPAPPASAVGRARPAPRPASTMSVRSEVQGCAQASSRQSDRPPMAQQQPGSWVRGQARVKPK